ncbi:MAG: hypothetical protein AAFX87_20385 [Bacteroidota bacterium]
MLTHKPKARNQTNNADKSAKNGQLKTGDTLAIDDNRSETRQLKKLQAIADTSNQLQEMAQLQAAADGYATGTGQLMVAVAGGQATFNRKDFTQLSHLNWAVKISGGPVVDLNASIASIGVDDDLHMIQHGAKGKMVHQINDSKVWIPIHANEIAPLLIKHLPSNYKGRIRISSCYSGTPVDDNTASLVNQIKALIKGSKREDLHDVWIVGWDGPTITNIGLESDSGTGAETVDASKVKLAGALQNHLLGGKYKELKAKWEKHAAADQSDLDELAALASSTFEEFYQEFTDLCKEKGYLLDYVSSLVIA